VFAFKTLIAAVFYLSFARGGFKWDFLI